MELPGEGLVSRNGVHDMLRLLLMSCRSIFMMGII